MALLSQGSYAGVTGPIFHEQGIRLRFDLGVGVPSLTGVGVIGRKACEGGIGNGAAGGKIDRLSRPHFERRDRSS